MFSDLDMAGPTALRAEFALRLSAMYATEVPAYATLVEVSREVNSAVVAAGALSSRRGLGEDPERLGSLDRVTAERHGAIRVGTPAELEQVGRIFAAMGMYPVGFYDLRDAGAAPVPVVSTAFRPIEPSELAVNPFRVFTSVLVPEDRRFFDEDLQAQLETFLAGRTLFGAELLELADAAVTAGGLPRDDAERFLTLATGAFALSHEPVDAAWYSRLESVSSVAADIGGVPSTHINHLTPRVLDIDELYRRMTERGIEMIDEIQGPPRWDGPDVLLRQTSFRALAENRVLRAEDGTITTGSLRVRFGEVEARGIALTAAGRDLVDTLAVEADERLLADTAGLTRQQVAAALYDQRFPRTERELAVLDLAYFTFRVAPGHPRGIAAPADLIDLVENGWVEITPIVYEDFLPRSAAGIFRSNLTGGAEADRRALAAPRDIAWLSDVLGRVVHSPDALYREISDASLARVRAELAAV